MTIDELIEKHPKIFHGERPHLGIAIGPGSNHFVDELCSAIEEKLDDDQFRVQLVKEKFSELRFYFSHKKPEIFLDLIESAREKSKTICEECGGDGGIFEIGGWYSTMCEEHARAHGKGRREKVYFIEDDSTKFPLPTYISKAPILTEISFSAETEKCSEFQR